MFAAFYVLGLEYRCVCARACVCVCVRVCEYFMLHIIKAWAQVFVMFIILTEL